MKVKLIKDYDKKHKKGFEIEIDQIKCDLKFAHGFGVRADGLRKNPVWLTIAWVVKIPDDIGFIPISISKSLALAEEYE